MLTQEVLNGDGQSKGFVVYYNRGVILLLSVTIRAPAG
jgi:hypothetical protein